MKVRFIHFFLGLTFAGTLGFLGGCSTSTPTDPMDKYIQERRINTQPWARQEGWEGAGPLSVLQRDRGNSPQYY